MIHRTFILKSKFNSKISVETPIRRKKWTPPLINQKKNHAKITKIN